LRRLGLEGSEGGIFEGFSGKKGLIKKERF